MGGPPIEASSINHPLKRCVKNIRTMDKVAVIQHHRQKHLEMKNVQFQSVVTSTSSSNTVTAKVHKRKNL
jgi:hypothetical protein